MTIRRKKTLKIVLIAVAVVLVVAAAGFFAWTRLAGYIASPEAAALAETAKTPQGWYTFEPAQPTDTGFVFYPGGLVDPAAYAPLMKQVSERGIMTVIVPMPFDLAVFGAGRAHDVIAAYPDIKHWIIGGHSLGGSMAAGFVEDNPAAVEGLVLLASYPPVRPISLGCRSKWCRSTARRTASPATSPRRPSAACPPARNWSSSTAAITRSSATTGRRGETAQRRSAARSNSGRRLRRLQDWLAG